MCGSDWRQYEPMYEEIDFNNLFYGYFAEPGYYVYMLVGRLLGLNFWTFFILTKILCFIVISRTLNEIAYNYRFLAWTIFLPQAGFYMFIDNPMRNLIAATIFLCSLPYLIKGQKIRYFICCTIALSFHLTAIITPIFYFLLTKNISTRTYVVSLLVIFTLFSTPYLFEILLSRIANINPFILKKVEWYILGEAPESEGSQFSIGAILQIAFYILILKARKAIEQYDKGLLILNGALIFILVYRLGLTISIFSRLQLYLVVFYVIGICYILRAFKFEARKYIIGLFFVYSCLIGYKNISTTGWKFVPYTNYIVYLLLGELKSYSERSNYNYIHTPYKETIPYNNYDFEQKE